MSTNSHAVRPAPTRWQRQLNQQQEQEEDDEGQRQERQQQDEDEEDVDDDVVDDVAGEARSAPWIPRIRGGGVATGFILGSEVRPAPKTSHTSETQEPLCPNIFRPYSGKSNMP